ncbi:MAG: acetylxylan esterase [Bacteroidales bacterium]|nr:acetylxylan esterase [Bacteroidales bacterium]
MKCKKNITTTVFLLFVLIVMEIGNVFSQSLDILPATGRNELFHSYLMSRGDSIWNSRRNAVEQSLLTYPAFLERQEQLRNNYLKILGDFPEKTPLNAVIIDTITTGDVYRIERLHYQSLPNHHVTANFYIPDTGTAPFPSVIITCGHYNVAKTYADYQNLAILFARHGIAALIVDPIAQGERYQINDTNGTLIYDGGSGTTECTLLDPGSMLAGTSVTAYELWDNHRGVDYLFSRPEVVDITKIGCTGHSGGGAQATYLLAYDQRLKVGVVANFLMNEETLYGTIGPQTGSQNLSYEGLYGIEHPDYITMFAPKPFMIIGTTVDFFDISATRETYAEVQRIYDSLGVSDKVTMFETSDAHDYTKVKREAAVRWFKRWLYDDNDTIIESGQTTLSNAALEVTAAGQVMHEFEDELNVTHLNINKTDSLADDREAFWTENTKDSCISKVAELLHLEKYDPVELVDSGDIDRDYYTIQRLLIKSGDHVPVPGLLFEQKSLTGKLPAVLYVDGRGKKTDAAANGIIEKVYVDSGNIVLAIDVRGFGETVDNVAKNESKHYNNEHRNAVISGYVGKTLIGQRVEDIMKALEVLKSNEHVDTDSIIIVGIDRAGPVVLHAAVLDTSYKKVVIRRAAFTSWGQLVANPRWSNMLTHVIPGALEYYDLPDLIDAISPREVEYAAEPVIVGINSPKISNGQYKLYQNYPNPFKDATFITYSIPESKHVTIQVFDELGRLVCIPVDEYISAGEYSVKIDGTTLQSGIYFYSFSVGENNISTRKMIVLP